MSTQNYKPSEKVETLSVPAKDLGPEFRAGEVAHEINRYRGILRNPAATVEERRIAEQRLAEFDEIKVVVGQFKEMAEKYSIQVITAHAPKDGVR